MAAFVEFGFDEGDKDITTKSKRFKGEAGKTYRLSFGFWPSLEEGTPDMSVPTPRFIGADRFYIPNVGYVLDGGGPAFAKLAGGPSRLAVGTLIVSWPLTASGKLDAAALSRGEYKIQPWVFSKDKYTTLKSNNAEWPYNEYDLKVVCTDTQYQKMTFTPMKDNLLAKLKDKSPQIYEDIVAKLAAAAEGLPDDICRKYTLAQLREKMTGDAASPEVSMESTENLDSLVDGLLG